MPGIKSDRWIREMAEKEGMIQPFLPQLISKGVISYGLSSYGYDFRLSDEFLMPLKKRSPFDPKKGEGEFVEKRGDRLILKARAFLLARSIEYFRIPRNILGLCVGKSTYARSGIVINITPLEPEWEGYITIAISNLSTRSVILYPGEGIGQVMFFEADEACHFSYRDRKGKYQRSEGIKPPLIER